MHDEDVQKLIKAWGLPRDLAEQVVTLSAKKRIKLGEARERLDSQRGSKIGLYSGPGGEVTRYADTRTSYEFSKTPSRPTKTHRPARPPRAGGKLGSVDRALRGFWWTVGWVAVFLVGGVGLFLIITGITVGTGLALGIIFVVTALIVLTIMVAGRG